jgi:hypothetical protein
LQQYVHDEGPDREVVLLRRLLIGWILLIVGHSINVQTGPLRVQIDNRVGLLALFGWFDILLHVLLLLSSLQELIVQTGSFSGTQSFKDHLEARHHELLEKILIKVAESMLRLDVREIVFGINVIEGQVLVLQ